MSKIKGKCLFISDAHHPYCDRRAYELMLKVALAEGSNIKEIVINGDFLDMYGVNGHGIDSRLKIDAEDEIEIGRKELVRIRKLFPRAKIVFLQGNHEFRLERYMAEHAPALVNLITTPKALDLAALKIKYIPFTPNQKYQIMGTSLYARHRPEGSGANAAIQTVKNCGASVIYGDIHKVQECQHVTLKGDYHRAIGVGWLGDKNHPVMNYVKNHHDWQLGFALITVLDSGLWFCENKTIINYTVVHNGKVFKT
jgi:predicted phosphodiesterase